MKTLNQTLFILLVLTTQLIFAESNLMRYTKKKHPTLAPECDKYIKCLFGGEHLTVLLYKFLALGKVKVNFPLLSLNRNFAGTITALILQQDTINIDLKLPTRWEDLTEKRLRYLFGLLAQGLSADEVKTYCLFRWSGVKVLHRYANGCAIKFGKQEFNHSRTKKLFEPPVFENKKKASGYFF